VDHASQRVAAAASGVDREEVAVDGGKGSVIESNFCSATASTGHGVVENRLAGQGNLGPNSAAGMHP